MEKILVITGPTASGKTAMADEICAAIGGEIISADSRQIYKNLRVGTNLSETRSPQHLVGFLEPTQKFDAQSFASAALSASAAIMSRGKKPVIVGGTGLYIKALFRGGLDNLPSADDGIRKSLEKLSASALYEKLRILDPPSAEKHKNNPQRLIRYIEICELAGRPASEIIRAEGKPGERRRYWCAGLSVKNDVLKSRIAARAKEMVAGGIIRETQVLAAAGCPGNAPALSAIGYRRVFDYLDGKIDAEALTSAISSATAKYAKRQMTWLRTQTPPDKWYDVSGGTDGLAARIIDDWRAAGGGL